MPGIPLWSLLEDRVRIDDVGSEASLVEELSAGAVVVASFETLCESVTTPAVDESTFDTALEDKSEPIIALVRGTETVKAVF